MTVDPRRVLGIDLGRVRIGLALSDPLRMTAQPLGRIPRGAPRVDLERIAKLVDEREVAEVVVGHPLLLSGEHGDGARDAEAYAARLKGELPCAVHLWDERLTTVQARRALIEGNVRRSRRREVVDAAAATLMLQSWLDAQPR